MGKLFDLLKATAGESGLRNALGRWRQAVSLEVDSHEFRAYDEFESVAGWLDWTVEVSGVGAA